MKSKEWRPTAFAETAPGVAGEAETGAGEQRRAIGALLLRLLTLDAGALVLSVLLLGRAFAQPVQRAAAALALGVFLLVLIGAGLAYLHWHASAPRAGAARPSADDRLAAQAAGALFAGFALGCAALAWFFWSNWFR
ncbi:MAG: hypothetical protein ABI699_03790 [Caldimonas sp.]